MTQKRLRISAVLIFLIVYILWMSTAAMFLHGDLVNGVPNPVWTRQPSDASDSESC